MNRFLILLILTLLVLGGGWWLVERQQPQADVKEAASSVTWYLGPVRDRMEEVDHLTLEGRDWTLQATRVDDIWRLDSMDGYPAKASSVHTFLRQLAMLRDPQAKTANPARLASLQLDPAGDIKPSRLKLAIGAGEPVIDAYLGKRTWSPEQGIYLRAADQNQSYLLSGRLDIPNRAMDWVETRLTDVAADEVVAIDILPAEGEAEHLVLDVEGDAPSLVRSAGLPEGRSWKTAKPFAALRGALAWMAFDQVRAMPEETVPPQRRIDWSLSDGTTIHMELWPAEADAAWLRLSAVAPAPSAEQAEDADQAEAEQAEDADQAEADKPTPQERAATWQEAWQGWQFRVPAAKAKILRQSLEDWLAAMPEAAAADAPDEQTANPD